MKKYLILAVLLAFPLLVKAEFVGCFNDNKCYDETLNLKYFCFMNGDCYNIDGAIAFNRGSSLVPIGFVPVPFVPVNTPIPNPLPTPIAVIPTHTPVVTPIINPTSMPEKTEVDINTLIKFSVTPHYSGTFVTFADWYYQNTKKVISLKQVGDVYTLTFNGVTYDNVINAEGKLAFSVMGLTPKTVYNYTLRVDRGDTYGEIFGIITTLGNDKLSCNTEGKVPIICSNYYDTPTKIKSIKFQGVNLDYDSGKGLASFIVHEGNGTQSEFKVIDKYYDTFNYIFSEPISLLSQEKDRKIFNITYTGNYIISGLEMKFEVSGEDKILNLGDLKH